MKMLTKQFLIFFVGSLFTLGVACVAIWGFNNLNTVTDQLLTVDVKINALSNNFARELAKSRRAEKEFFIFPDKPHKQVKYIAKWNKSYDAIISEYLVELDKLLRTNRDSTKLAMVVKAKELMNANIDEWKVVTDRFIEFKSYDMVNKAEYGVFKKRTHELEDISVGLIDGSMKDVVESRMELQSERTSIENLIKGIIVFAVIWGGLAPIFFSRRLTSVIKSITKVTDEISRGRIGTPLQVNRKDELGDLASAITRMQKSLQIIIKKLRTA